MRFHLEWLVGLNIYIKDVTCQFCILISSRITLFDRFEIIIIIIILYLRFSSWLPHPSFGDSVLNHLTERNFEYKQRIQKYILSIMSKKKNLYYPQTRLDVPMNPRHAESLRQDSFKNSSDHYDWALSATFGIATNILAKNF